MTDLQLAIAIGKATGVKPKHKVVSETGVCESCEHCTATESDMDEEPCYARLLSDLNWAWKVLEWFPQWTIRETVVMILKGNRLYDVRIEKSGKEALCLAILRAAGKALKIGGAE